MNYKTLGEHSGSDAGAVFGSSLPFPANVLYMAVASFGGWLVGATIDKTHEVLTREDDIYWVSYINSYEIVNAAKSGHKMVAGASTSNLLVIFNKELASNPAGSFYVVNETHRTLHGEPVYAATDLDAASPALVNSEPFLRYMQHNYQQVLTYVE